METHFFISQGELTFEEDCIQIDDKSTRWTKGQMILIGGIFPILFGLQHLWKYPKTHDPFNLWFGISLTVIGIPIL
jgi:hypothetical protein